MATHELSNNTFPGPLTSSSWLFGAGTGSNDAAPDSIPVDLIYDYVKALTDQVYPTQQQLSSVSDTASAALNQASSIWRGRGFETIDFAPTSDVTGLVTYQQLLDATINGTFDVDALDPIVSLDGALDKLLIYDASAAGYKSATPDQFTTGLLPLTTRGDIMVRDASANVRLAIGASGLPLVSNGTDPLYATIGTAGITDDAVTYVKLQDISATSRVLGRITSGAGVAEELTGANIRTIIGVGSDVQAWDADIDAIAALASTGIAVRTASNAWAQRTLQAPATGFSITNPAGVAGDPTFVLANDLAALEALSGTDTIYYRSGADTWTAVTVGGFLSFSAGTLNVGDAELTALAGLTSAADSAPYFTGSGSAALMTVTAAARTVLDDASVGAMLATLGGQPLDGTLTALAAYSTNGLLTQTAADTFTGRTLTGTANEITLTNGDGVSGNPTASLPAALTFTGKTVTGGTFASPTAITGLPDPTSAQDAATKNYVDVTIQGLNQKPTARLATVAALPANIYANGASGVGATLTGVSTGVLTVDGGTVALNDILLIKDEAAGANNGLYKCTLAGAIGVAYILTRDVDMDASSEFNGGFIPVDSEGTANSNSLWLNTNTSAPTVGTTAITFVQLNKGTDLSAGTGISITGNVVAISDAELLAILGLTSAADTAPYFTGSGTADLMTVTAAARSILDDASVAAIATTLGLGTGDSPQFTAVNIGHATDTTLTRVSAGVAAIEGSNILLASGLGSITQAYDAQLADIAGITFAQGDVLYFNGTNLVNLGAGTSGHFLKTQGAAANPLWAAVPGGGDALTSNTLAQFAATTSAQLAGVISDETGSGALVFATSPTLVTPVIGTPASGTLTNCTGLPVAGGGTGGTTAQTARAGLSAASFDAGASLGLLTNPFFEISQENGTTAGAAASAYYPADQWYALESSDAVLSVQNVANPFSGTATLKRLQSSIKATATTADGTIAAAQYIQPCAQVIEGTFWRSLGWGTADARAVDIPIIAQCSVTGTYPVAITNAAGNRSYTTTISLTANTPTVCFVTIPGDTGGTWVTSNAASAKLFIGSVGGSDYQASSLNAWEATDNFTHSSCTNWAASGTTDFFQVAYAQIFPSGVLPFTSAAQITGEALQLLLNMRRPHQEELMRCQRYYERVTAQRIHGTRFSTGSVLANAHYMVEKRATSPTLTLLDTAATKFHAGSAGLTGTLTIGASQNSPQGSYIQFDGISGGSAGAAVIGFDSSSEIISVNSRM